MRLNKFIALSTGVSRRSADSLIAAGSVAINGQQAKQGQSVAPEDNVTVAGKTVTPPEQLTTIMLNKPAGYVCSRNGQGSRTIYELLPEKYRHLKPAGRLDKDSTGLLIMTNDGELANSLTHPSHHKTKLYEVKLDKPLLALHRQMISDYGIELADGPSRLTLNKLDDNDKHWQVTMSEGRNRQIRRTFQSMGYRVTGLHRTNFGNYSLDSLQSGSYKII